MRLTCLAVTFASASILFSVAGCEKERHPDPVAQSQLELQDLVAPGYKHLPIERSKVEAMDEVEADLHRWALDTMEQVLDGDMRAVRYLEGKRPRDLQVPVPIWAAIDVNIMEDEPRTEILRLRWLEEGFRMNGVELSAGERWMRYDGATPYDNDIVRSDYADVVHRGAHLVADIDRRTELPNDIPERLRIQIPPSALNGLQLRLVYDGDKIRSRTDECDLERWALQDSSWNVLGYLSPEGFEDQLN